MLKNSFKLPDINESDRTPIVCLLLDIIAKQAEQLQIAKEQIQALRDEIAVLKGQKPKPKIPQSRLEGKDKDGEEKKEANGNKRPGSAKRSKTQDLEIHKTITLRPDGLVEGAVFKGYKDYTVQDLIIQPFNIQYRRERWLLPNGETIIAPLPPEVAGHFASTLISYIQYQYSGCRVTQPLLLEQMHEIGIDISSGELNAILTEEKEIFHEEKEDILKAGLDVSKYIQADDTGARHKGQNGYCTCIASDLFTYFSSSESKSRANFLGLLRVVYEDYIINDDSLTYMKQYGLRKDIVDLLTSASNKVFANESEWKSHLASLGIASCRHIKIATESALLGSAIDHGLSRDLPILSDDAGQFNILVHALCWVHMERIIHKLIGFNDEQRQAVQNVRDQIWNLYKKLKAYKEHPESNLRVEIESDFEVIFSQTTSFETLNQALKRIYNNKAELLRVLDYPDIPLHNNGCETDVREQVTKRNVSGGTRSAYGRFARDTFLSLKKTCRKLGISFWKYLNDRNATVQNIPHLAQLIRNRAASNA